MSKENKQDKEPQEHGGKHFDMYHFFSRKDVIFIGIMVLLLLVYFLYLSLSGNVAV